MKCLSKPMALAAFLVCLALAIISSSSVQQVEARAFRQDVQAQRPPPADHILLRERYYAMRYHGVHNGDEPVAPVEDEERVPEVPGAKSNNESVVRRLLAALLRLFASSPVDTHTVKDFVIPDEVKFLTPATPMAPVKRGHGGKLCVAGMCGLSLFFASLWVTFVACFAVVYLLDRQLHRKLSKDDEVRKKSDEKESTPASKVPAAAVVRRSAVITNSKRSMTGIRTRMLNYYQDITDMSSSLLHRRPPLGI